MSYWGKKYTRKISPETKCHIGKKVKRLNVSGKNVLGRNVIRKI